MATLKARIVNDPRVDELLDETDQDNGWWVYLKPGYTADPYSAHDIHEDTLTACLSKLRAVEACTCADCLSGGFRNPATPVAAPVQRFTSANTTDSDADHAAPLTPAQVFMLRTAVECPDGTVLAAGFQKTTHAAATAKALTRRGLVEYVKRGRGYDVYRITPAGRDAVGAGVRS